MFLKLIILSDLFVNNVLNSFYDDDFTENENNFQKTLDLYKKNKDQIFRRAIPLQKMENKSFRIKEINMSRRAKFRTLKDFMNHLG